LILDGPEIGLVLYNHKSVDLSSQDNEVVSDGKYFPRRLIKCGVGETDNAVRLTVAYLRRPVSIEVDSVHEILEQQAFGRVCVPKT